MTKLYTFTLLVFSLITLAQEEEKKPDLKIDLSGYIDTYYSYDFDQPEGNSKQSFLYSYNRQNEFNINIALIRASISYDNVYAKLSVHAGTYVDDNYANEDLKLFNEAYLGVYLNKSKKTSLEAGILPSYIGFETAISHSNLTLTRSNIAEATPYYMTGIKLNHQFSNKLSLAIFATNGWQRIDKPDNNVPPALGTQLAYKSNENSTLNWSTFIGKEYYGTELAYRYFSNLYWDKTWNAKWRTISGFDFGIQDTSSANNKHVNWMSPILISQYKISDKWQMAHRIEYYSDKNNAVINVFNLPFETLGNSINFDFLPNTKMKIRTEAKWLHATENVFDLGYKKDNFSVTTSMSFEF
ncbi:MAG: outer membrane beta-barrel protein [Bacteroidota bacterium]